MKSSWSKVLAPLAVVLTVAAGVVACDAKEEKKKSKNDAISQNVDSVYKNFVPGSLKLDSSTSLALSGGSDPCAGLDFFSCQPKLLKMYIKMAEDVVKLVNNFAPQINEYAGSKEDGSSGADDIEANEAGDINKISYNKVSGDEYKVIMHAKDKGPVVLLGVRKDGDSFKYTFDFMMANTKNFDPKTLKKFRGEVTFTNENTFDVSFQLGDVACNPTDLGAPDFLAIDVSRSGDTWKGKSMMRSPRWGAPDPKTCDTAVTDSTKLYTYTDFVANKDKATSSLYLAKKSLADVANFNDWATQNFCTAHPGLCNGDGKFAGTDAVVATTYQVPYCANTNTDVATWNGACEGLPATDYTSAEKWLLPQALDDKVQEMIDYQGPEL